MEMEVFSARTGRQLATIELIDAIRPLRLGERYSFRIMDGFGNMWRKAFDQENMTLKKEQEDVLLRIVAFPAEEDAIGILDIDMTLPPVPQLETVSPQVYRRPSFIHRVRRYFSRPSA